MAIRDALILGCALSICAATSSVWAQARRPTPAAARTAPNNAHPGTPTSVQSLPAGIDYRVTVAPDTVGVGTPFRVIVHVRGPANLNVVFPPGPDSGTAVEALDPRNVRSRSDSGATDVIATYRLAAWDLGRLPLALGNLVVTDRNGDHAVALGGLSIVVAPTVPARGAGRVPRPARDFYPDRAPWWWRWAIVGLACAVLLIGWLVLRWMRRRARRAVAPAGPLPVAVRELEDLDRLGLIEAGEWGRYVTLVADVVRRFLARRLTHAPLSSTTSELLAAVHDDARVPLDRLRSLFVQIDLVKFAGQHLTAETARATSQSANALIRDIDTAVTAAAVAAREAAARQTSREFEQRRAARAVGSSGRAA